MLAAAVPSSFAGRLADFGAGAGAAGLAVASRCPKADVVLVERSAEMAEFAARNAGASEQNAHLAGRVSLLAADVTLTGQARAAAGLADAAFDFVHHEPALQRGARPGDARRAERRGACHGGRPVRALAAQRRRRGQAARRPGADRPARSRSPPSWQRSTAASAPPRSCRSMPRADQPAIRIILRAVRGSRAGLSLMPPLVLHDASGDLFSPRADAINNGRASLVRRLTFCSAIARGGRMPTCA